MLEPLSKRSVLLTAQRPSDYVEMRRCAVAFHEMGWTSLLLYFGQNNPNAEEQEIFDEVVELQRKGIISQYEFVRFVPARVTERKLQLERETLRQRLRKTSVIKKILDAHPSIRRSREALRNSYPNEVLRLIRVAIRIVLLYLADERKIRQSVANLKPDAIILPEDVVGLITPLVIKAGHRCNIPSVIVPYTIANQQEAFLSLQHNPSYHNSHWANRAVGWMFPRWKMTQDNLTLVRLPAPYILGHVLTSTSPPNPWMMNSGFANAIAVENDAMLDYYLGSGLPRLKMHVLGAIYDDYLAKYKLNKAVELLALRSELGIVGAKPLLVIGGCPDQSTSCPAGFEFTDITDFTKQLADALQPLKARYEILMRPHPNFTQMADVMAAHGIHTTTIDTARLVALSDIYLAFGSATIRWAISCAVPTLNYDVFHYDYDDYKNVGGVVHIDSFDQLRKTFSDLLSNPTLASRLETEIAVSSKRWGNLDGKSTQRIAGLIDSLCRLDRVPRTSR